jgi:ParB/RepB/Spo0J family partition protein
MTKLPSVPVTPLPYEYKTVALSNIELSKTNPRKHIDAAKLSELAEDMKLHGILQAPVVRPKKAAGQVVINRYILIAGERRCLAAGEAGLKEIQVKVLDVDDAVAAELQLVENDQREDISALERAEGYHQLHKKHGLTVELIAAKVGKSRASVYETMKLLELKPEAKKALLEGELLPSCAALMTSLPDEVQADALDVALNGIYGSGRPSFRDFRDWIRDEFMLDLADAPFDITDALLVAAAGACTVCPKRTGAQAGQAELFSDEKGKKAADLCRDKPCHASKVAANKTQAVAKAKEAGKPVLSAAESKAALKGDHYSPWIRLDQKHYETDEKGIPLAKELEKAKDFEAQLAVDDEGKLIKVAKKDEVRAALKDVGSKAATAAALVRHEPYKPRAAANPEKQKREDDRRALLGKVADRAIAAVVAHIEKKGLALPLLRLAAEAAWVASNNDLGKRRLLGAGGFEKHFGKAKEPVLLGVLFEAMVETGVTAWGPAKLPDELVEACKLAGVDLKKLEKELTPAKEPEDKLKTMLLNPHGKKATKKKSSKGGGANARSPA